MKKLLLAILSISLLIASTVWAGPMEDYGQKADAEKCKYIGAALEDLANEGWSIEADSDKLGAASTTEVIVKKGDEELRLLLKNDSDQEIEIDKSTVVDSIDDLTFVYEGIVIKMHYDSAPVVEQLLELLGEPVSYTEEESCAFKGVDKCYEYEDFILITYPTAEGIDRIKTLVFMSDAVSTSKGISVGDDAEKVAEAYGEESLMGTAFLVKADGQQLVIAIENDVVSMIQYVGLLGY